MFWPPRAHAAPWNVAECCSVLKCVAVCCSALQCVAVYCSVWQRAAARCSALQRVAMRCAGLHGVAGSSCRACPQLESTNQSKTRESLHRILCFLVLSKWVHALQDDPATPEEYHLFHTFLLQKRSIILCNDSRAPIFCATIPMFCSTPLSLPEFSSNKPYSLQKSFFTEIILYRNHSLQKSFFTGIRSLTYIAAERAAAPPTHIRYSYSVVFWIVILVHFWIDIVVHFFFPESTLWRVSAPHQPLASTAASSSDTRLCNSLLSFQLIRLRFVGSCKP